MVAVKEVSRNYLWQNVIHAPGYVFSIEKKMKKILGGKRHQKVWAEFSNSVMKQEATKNDKLYLRCIFGSDEGEIIERQSMFATGSLGVNEKMTS